MRDALLGEISLGAGLLEVRQYAWHEAEKITFKRENFMLSRLLTQTQGPRSFGWQLRNSQQTVWAAQMSVVPPSSPVSVAFDHGEAVIVSCILNPDYFQQSTGIEHWSDDHTLTCLGLRSSLIGQIFNRLAQEVFLSRHDSTQVAEAFVGALAVEVARGIERSIAKRRPGQLAPWQLQRVFALIEKESDGMRLSVEHIAELCMMSSRHLMRAFKASTGMTIHEHANEVRMRRAITALKQDDIPLKVLSARLGFKSPSAFSAAFHLSVGCTPSEYRMRSRVD